MPCGTISRMSTTQSAIMSEIRAAAAVRRMSIKELSRRIGSDYSALRNYLDGTRVMSLPTLYRIAEALSIDASELTRRGELRAANDALAAHILDRTGDEQAVTDAMHRVARSASGGHDATPDTMGKPDKRRRKNADGTA